MDQKSFKERVARLNEVSKTIETLPVEIRALSFPLLQEYITGEGSDNEKHPPPGKDKSPKPKVVNNSSRDEFLASFNHEKPSDNVRLIIAALYRDYGTEPFSLEEIQTLATDTGVTIPERFDMTIKSAKHKGKSLFTPTSRGHYKPTVHGEQYLKETYKVIKGTAKKSIAE
jgi:hypothetical protein